MINFRNISIEGFCSIKNFEWNLSTNGVTIVKGRNGVGKSTFLLALSWVLYGKVTKDINSVTPWKEIQDKDYKGTKCQVFFEKNGITYSIIRCRNYTEEIFGSKGKDRLILLKDGIEFEEKSKILIQREIDNILGMSFELFKNSLMFGQGTKRLIQESSSDKKKLFEEIFELEYLNIARDKANRIIKDLKEDIYDLESERKRLGIEVEETKESYRELRSNERNFDRNILDQKREIKTKQKKIKEQIESFSINENLLTKSENKLASLKEALEILEKNYRESKGLINNDNLSEVIQEVMDLLTSKKYDKAYKTLSSLLGPINLITKYSYKKGVLLNKIEKKREIIHKEKSKSKDLELLEYKLKDLEKQYNKLNNEKQKILSPKYKEKISKIQKELRKVDELYHNRLDLLNNYNWLIQDPLGNKGLKSYIMESSLDFLNHQLQKYSDIIGFSIEFGIDLDTTKKDFYTLINIDGHYADYGELSGGQKQLVNLAMAMAMHESLSMSKGINLLILDEVFESLDKENIEIVIDLIKKTSENKSIYIITHQDSLPLGNAKILSVDRKEGVTTFQ